MKMIETQCNVCGYVYDQSRYCCPDCGAKTLRDIPAVRDASRAADGFVQYYREMMQKAEQIRKGQGND